MSKYLAAKFIIRAAIALAAFQSQQSLAQPAVSGEQAIRTALRVQVDLERGRRWELGWGVASAYDLASGQLIRSVRLPGAIISGAKDACLPDMLLSPSGALIVSSNAQSSLWRISPSHFEVERFDIEVDSDQDKDFGFTGLTWSTDEMTLYAMSAPLGAWWRIDLDSTKASKVDRPIVRQRTDPPCNAL